MTDDTRLDVATLLDVLDGVDRYRIRVEALGTSRRASQRGVVAACKDIADTLRKSIAAAESAPPRLSDWVAACEGTKLGEPQVIPSWELRANPAGDFAHVDFIEAIGAADVVVTSYVKPTHDNDDGCRETRTRCSTPAELRAALERLAGGEAPR